MLANFKNFYLKAVTKKGSLYFTYVEMQPNADDSTTTTFKALANTDNTDPSYHFLILMVLLPTLILTALVKRPYSAHLMEYFEQHNLAINL